MTPRTSTATCGVTACSPPARANRGTVLVLDLSPSRISNEEAATLTFNFQGVRYRYNTRRDFLILEFPNQRTKLQFIKRLPQWVWNRGCVVWEHSDAELEQWLSETLA